MSKSAQVVMEKLLDAREVCTALSCSKVTLFRKMKRGGFPQPLRLDPANPRSRLRFRASEIFAWIEAQQLATVAAESTARSLNIRVSDAAGVCAAN
jgi:predicted DNA-binding transcriptional regulator AlpA